MAEKRIKLSDQVKRALGASGMSQYIVGKLTGIDEGTLSRWRHGKGGMSVAGLDALADVLLLDVVQRGLPAIPPKKKPGRKKGH